MYSFINQSKYLQWYYNTSHEGYPTHFHHGNFFEFIVPLEGWFEVEVEGKIYQLHSLKPTKHQGGRIIFMVNMDFMCLYENYSDMVSFHAPTLWMKESKDPAYIKIFQLIIQIRNEYYHQEPFRDTYIYSMILQIFVILSRSRVYEPQYEAKLLKNGKKETFS